jgi:D-glycero-D-manno-heptose 1,7-bisphosphate phosphatase
MNKAAFLDRDGVINRRAPEGDYITRWEELKFLPGVAEAIGLLNRSGFLVIMVTNQRCVAKGITTLAEVKALHHKMCAELALAGAQVDEVYCCPHDTAPPCDCRKPEPGMLLEAAQVHGITLAESWMIGDSESDIQAGRKAGCKTVRIGHVGEVSQDTADVIAASLLDAVCQLLQRDKLSLHTAGPLRSVVEEGRKVEAVRSRWKVSRS